MDKSTSTLEQTKNKSFNASSAALYKKALEEKIESLKFLCDTLDPYSDIPKVTQDELLKLGIIDLSNPFTITNQLLLMMEDSIEELQKL